MKNVVIFMSGSGNNTEALLSYAQNNSEANYRAVALVTDRPDSSRTYEIGEKYNLPVVALDIYKFYAEHGEKNIGLINERRWEIRELWTAELSKKISELSTQIDMILLAGFEPLTNITNEYITLNVHPGDLTFEINGERVLNGLAIKPIENAISYGHRSLRSSVIIAQNFTGSNSDIDAGPILGVSSPLEIDFMGYELKDLQELYHNRPAKLPKGYSDNLREVAKFNQERLKYAGDIVVFPAVVNDFASGMFRIEGNELYYKNADTFIKIKTVEYSKNGKTLWEL